MSKKPTWIKVRYLLVKKEKFNRKFIYSKILAWNLTKNQFLIFLFISLHDCLPAFCHIRIKGLHKCLPSRNHFNSRGCQSFSVLHFPGPLKHTFLKIPIKAHDYVSVSHLKEIQMLSYTNCPKLTEGWVKCKGRSPYTLKKLTKTQYCNIPRHSFSCFLSATIT